MKKRTTNTRTLIEIINEKDIKELLTVDPKKPVIDAFKTKHFYYTNAIRHDFFI